MVSNNEIGVSMAACMLLPLCIMGIAALFIIPFSVTLSVAVDNQDHVERCDIKKTAYVTSISDSEDEVIVILVNSGYNLDCPRHRTLPYPRNRTLSLNEMVEIYEECWSRCYSHKIESYEGGFAGGRCPKKYYWEPPKSTNDCNIAIGFMSFIVAVAGLGFLIGVFWESFVVIISMFVCGSMAQKKKESFETC